MTAQNAPTDAPLRTLIIGAGAVGTVLAAHLMRAGAGVRVYSREADLPGLQGVRQLRLDRVTGRPPLTADKPVLTTAPELDDTDIAFICVKHPDLPDVLDALAAVSNPIPAGCTLVPCLNGVGVAHRIRQRFPDATVAAATVMFNAQLLQPLYARITTRPHLLINSADRRLLHAFDGSGMRVDRVRDEAAAWGKLLINLANPICALTYTTFHDVLTNADLKACFLASLDEAVRVLKTSGADYRLPAPLPYPLWRRALEHAGPAALRLSRFHRSASAHSYPSMVADVAAGRPTEIDQLNGEIVRIGDLTGQATPVNGALVQQIHALEGQRAPDYLTPAELRRVLPQT